MCSLMSTRKTPLYNLHLAGGGKMVDFAGWQMPIQYTSIMSEHKVVRERVGVFDVSHMGQIFVSGEDTVSFLSYVTTWDMSRQKIGDCRYCHILNDDGNIIDDIIVYTLSNNEFMFVPNASMIDVVLSWLISHSPDFNVVIEDKSAEYFCIALQGPDSPRLLGQYFNTSLGAFQLTRSTDFIISGTGYTGEKGYEIIGPCDQAENVWEALLDMGALPIGLGARDTLRLEKGFLLSGQDFTGKETTLETGYSWVIDWNHEFIGRGKLLDQKKESYSKLSGIILEDRGIIRPECRVFFDGNEVSKLTSGTLSPTIRKGIGLAYLDLPIDAQVTVEVRGNHLNGRVVQVPFL